MARILYGVHGTGHGHAVRALTIARHFPEHEFLFLSHGTGAAILGREYPVLECPNPETPIRGHRVVVGATLYSNLRVWSRYRRFIRQILAIMERFRPDACLSDYEYFLPRACRRLGSLAFPWTTSTLSLAVTMPCLGARFPVIWSPAGQSGYSSARPPISW